MDRILRLRKPRKIFYGWVALAGAMLVCYVAFGNTYAYPVFLPRICEEMNWARGSVSAALTLYLLMEHVPGPVVGLFIRKFGPRKSIIVGGLAMALGLGSLSQITEIWQLYLLFGLLTGTGWSFGVSIPSTTIASNWFVKRRGLAFSLIMTAGGIGGLTFPAIFASLIPAVGWRVAWLFLAVMVLVFSVGIAGLIVRNTPEEIGQRINGVGDSALKNSSATINETLQASTGWTVTAAMRSRSYWLILGFSMALGFSGFAVAGHQAMYLEDLGYSPVVAAATLGLLPGISIAGRFGYGFLAMKFKARDIACAALGSMLIGVLILINATTLPLIYIYVVFFGFGYGLMLVASTDLLVTYYGRTIYPQLMGWTGLLRSISSTGPWIAGTIRDAAGSYTPAFMATAIILAIGLACAVMLRSPKPPSH